MGKMKPHFVPQASLNHYSTKLSKLNKMRDTFPEKKNLEVQYNKQADKVEIRSNLKMFNNV